MSTDLMAVDVLSDELMLKILHIASGSEISLADLCISCEITGAACLRRVQDLVRMGFLREISHPSDDGYSRYTSNVNRIEVRFNDGLMYCKVERKGGKEERDCLDPITGLHPHWKGNKDRSNRIPGLMLGSTW